MQEELGLTMERRRAMMDSVRRECVRKHTHILKNLRTMLIALMSVAIGLLALPYVAGAASTKTVVKFTHPTKVLCKKTHYKIGYDVFSGSQPFADTVTKGLLTAAKSLGCVTVLKTIDNETGPVAIGNLKTLVSEGIQGFVDFQVLAPYQPAVAKELKVAKIPGVAIIGATLPGWPGVGASNYKAAYEDGLYLARQAKKRYPKTVPYLLGGAEPSSGAIIMERYNGAVAGEKKVFPHLPKTHVIEVHTHGVETTAYSNALSALSDVPSGSLVLMTGVNDEATGGLWKAAVARGFKKVLVNSFGGDTYGLSQVCSQRKDYVGAWYLEPKVWGRDSLTVIMDEMNHTKVHIPKTVGVIGKEVTYKTRFLHCK